MPDDRTLRDPLQKVRNNFRVEWYRCPIDHSKLRQLMQPSDLQGWFQAGGHLLIAIVTGGGALFFFEKEMWVPFFLALFLHGTVTTFFKGIAAHELGHGTVFRTKWLNKIFLRIYSIVSWHNFHEYAMSHTYHHRYTLHPKGDREVVLPQYARSDLFYFLQLFSINIFGGLYTSGCLPIVKGTIKTALGKFGTSVLNQEWSEALYTAHPTERKYAVNWARSILLFHFIVITVTIYTQLWALPLVLTFQQFTANWLKHFVGFPMHCGLRSNVSDFRKSVRSMTLDPISEFLYWRMNWHLEHHMYAGIPCYNLKKLHQLVAHDMPKVRTLRGAWQEMRETWEKQRVDSGYEFDTPVPGPANCEDEAPDPLATSIGDLAPKALLK